MGISHRAATKRKVPLPLKLDVLAKDLCRCQCHTVKGSVHPGNHCHCNPSYRVDGHALAVVQLDEREVTHDSYSAQGTS